MIEKQNQWTLFAIIAGLVILGAIFFLQNQGDERFQSRDKGLHATSTPEGPLLPSQSPAKRNGQGSTASTSGDIVVFSPRVNQTIENTFLIEGQARQSLGRQLGIRLFALESGRVLFVGTIITNPMREETFASFKKNVPLPEGLIDNLSMALEISSKGEAAGNVVHIPLTYKRTTQGAEGN